VAVDTGVVCGTALDGVEPRVPAVIADAVAEPVWVPYTRRGLPLPNYQRISVVPSTSAVLLAPSVGVMGFFAPFDGADPTTPWP
jgi:hypothetical protein